VVALGGDVKQLATVLPPLIVERLQEKQKKFAAQWAEDVPPE